MSIIGACYAARTLPGNETIAIDVGPVAKEYGIEFSPAPVVAYGDLEVTYNKLISDKLFSIGTALGLSPQSAVWSYYGSDASTSRKYGQSGKAGLLCFPTENTHGYEVIHKDAITQCAHLLSEYIVQP